MFANLPYACIVLQPTTIVYLLTFYCRAYYKYRAHYLPSAWSRLHLETPHQPMRQMLHFHIRSCLHFDWLQNIYNYYIEQDSIIKSCHVPSIFGIGPQFLQMAQNVWFNRLTLPSNRYCCIPVDHIYIYNRCGQKYRENECIS